MRSMLVVEEALGNWLVRDYRRRTLRKATLRAHHAFMQQNPQWEEQLFDEHFLHHGAAALLEQYLEGTAPDPAALANAWAEQWGWAPQARARFVTELTPVAVDFLKTLEAELHHVWFSARTVTPSRVRSLPTIKSCSRTFCHLSISPVASQFPTSIRPANDDSWN